MNQPFYFEIQCDDLARAKAFYEAAFRWNIFLQPEMPIEYYRIETEGIAGGLLGRPVDVPSLSGGTNAFTVSMEVRDFDATAEKIMAGGGRVAMEKFAVPGKCWQGYFIDTERNTFGIFEADESAE